MKEKLPRVLKKREADITPKIKEWIKNNLGTCAVEIKITDTDTCPPSALKTHQKQALHTVKHGKLTHKIADMGRRNVFDIFQLYKCPAYVIVHFSKHKITLVIDVDEWNGARYDQEDYVYKF